MNQRIVIGGDGPQPLTVEWAKAGQIVKAPTVTLSDHEPYMVLSPCGDLFHVYFCETCSTNLANQAQIEMHCEKGGHHRFAIWCSRRSVYEAAAPLDLKNVAVAQ